VSGDPYAALVPQGGGDPYSALVPKQPGVLDRVKAALSSAVHSVGDFIEHSPAQQIVDKNKAAGRKQPDAFGSITAAVPSADQETVRQAVTQSGPFRRAAARGVIPSLAGAGGFGGGFAAGGALTAPAEAIPVVGPVVNLGGALLGGLLGAYGASSGADYVQDKALGALPGTIQSALGQDAATRQADAQQHPIQSFSGSLAPMLLSMRPGFAPGQVAEDAPLLTRVLASRAGGAAVGATLGGGQEAAREELTGEGLDPTKIAIATGAGAALNRPTALGSKLFEFGATPPVMQAQRAARAAGSVRDFFMGNDGTEARQGYDVNATARVIPQELLPAPKDGANDNLQPRPEPTRAEADPYAELVPNHSPEPVVAPVSQAEPKPASQAAPAAVAEPGTAVGAGEPTAPFQTAQASEPQPLQDGEQYVRTPAGNKVRTRMEVVDASTLNKATGDLQNRDRSRDTTTLQVQDIIGKFDPELLGNDPSSDRGAPIAHPDNTVLSGNGRMLALNEIYANHPEKAAAYRAFIEGQGHSTEGIERPVLIRRVTQDMSPEEARQFVVESNKDNKLELSPVERARSDADSVTPEMLSRYAGGDLNSGANAGFIEAFTKRLTAGEMGNVIGSDRRLTTAGVERIENAVVAKAYDHPKLLEKLMESAHNEIRAITSSLANVAPAWATMRAAAKADEIDGRYDITPDLADAAMRVAEARRAGTKPADILTQIDAFDRPSPITERLIEAFYSPGMKRPASIKAVTEFLRDYIAEANRQTKTEGLFGAEPGKDPADILNELLKQREGGETLFDAPMEKENAHVPRTDPAAAEQQSAARSRGHHEADDRAPPPATNQRAQPGAAADAPSSEPGTAVAPSAAGDGDGRADGASADGRGAGAADGRHDDVNPEAEGERVRRDGLAEDPLDVPDEHKPSEKGGYQPSFAEASFTDRQSAYHSAVDALGMDRDKFNLLPPRRKAKLLIDALDKLTGIKVTVASDALLQHAVDQMLDAHQTLQGMAEVLGLAPRGLSLDGTLSLHLLKRGNFLGRFSPSQVQIDLPKRSNSFAHEWGHALDYHLLAMTDGDGSGLSGAVRSDGGEVESDTLPNDVRGAFVDLLNSMFFDKAGQAERIMQLEKKLAAAKTPKQKAAYTAQLQRLNDGSSKARGIDSGYYAGAKEYEGPGGDYWTKPTEMFARAFESWIGFKVANAGFGSEFIAKGNLNYLSDVEDRFRLTFPKGEDRVRIFDAFQKLTDAINLNQVLAAGGKAEAASGFDAEATPEEKAVVGAARNRAKRSLNPFRADLEAVETWFHNRDVDREEDSRRGADPVKLMNKINNARSIAFSAAADGVKMVAKRWGSKAAMTIHDHFANDLGGTRATPRGWTDAVDMATNKALNPVFSELEKIGGKGWVYKKLTREQKDVLAKLLTGKDVEDDTGLMRLASIMRKSYNDAWYMQRNAGLDVGYVNDAAYLNRQVDRELVTGEPDKFLEQAAKVYKIVFDRDVGASAEAIAADPARIETFIDLAKQLGVDGYAELKAAMKDGSDTDPLPIIEGMFDELRTAFADHRAFAYRDSILHQETFADHTANPSIAQSEKHRTLPAEADDLLRDFYNPDPVSALAHYVHNAVRRSEWNRRFGRPAGAKKTSPTIAKQLDDRMAREGVPASDRRFVWDLVDRMSGRYQRKGWLANPAVSGSLALLRVKGTLALMGRTVTLSFFEPASLGIVTGRPVDGLMAVAKTWAAILHKGSRDEMAEWARAHGFVKHHLLEQMMSMDRFGTTSDTPSRLDRLPAAMFRNTGLTFLTHMSEAAVVDVGRRSILNDMAHRVVRGGSRGKDAAALMGELGVRDPQAFAKAVVALGNGLPNDDWMNSPEGADYATALQRLSRYTIQKPAPAELAPLGRNPLMSYASYSITAFIQSSYRNLLKRNIIKGFRLLGEHEFGTLGRYVAGTLLSVGLLYGLQLLASLGREYLFNPQRQDKWERDGTWWRNNLGLAAQRTFSFGWGDSLMNAATGLRYNRDLAYLPLGAYAGNDVQNIGKIAKATPLPKTQAPFLEPPSQSRKTNTGEYNAIAGLYNLLAGPAISGAISAAPGGGPIATVLGGATQASLTGPIASEKAAEAIVGPKEGSVGPDGEKVKSGPTKYDKALNRVFGEKAKKKAAEE
jgi:hypothetical protein